MTDPTRVPNQIKYTVFQAPLSSGRGHSTMHASIMIMSCSSLKYIQFYNKYPEMGIVLELNTTKPPLVCIIPTSANITIYSAVNVNAIGYNGSRVLAFVLGMVRSHSCECVCCAFNIQANSVCKNITVLHLEILQKTMVDLKPALRSQGSRHFIYADLENFE